MSTKLKLFGLFAAVATFVMAFAPACAAPASARPRAAASTPQGVHKIKHVIMIMQENRSFDTYFGTFPGADGIPGEPWYGGGGQNPGTIPCVPDPKNTTTGCDQPTHTNLDSIWGGPHDSHAFVNDTDGGKMDGFVRAAQNSPQCKNVNDPACESGGANVRTTTTAARSRTTGPTRATSCCRTTCSNPSRAGRCPRTCSWCPDGRRSAVAQR